MSEAPIGPGVSCQAPQRPFSRREKTEDVDMDGVSTAAEDQVSEATRRRVEAAKSYIENMYQEKRQTIQDRYARCVCAVPGSRMHARTLGTRPHTAAPGGIKPPRPSARELHAR